MRNPDVRDSLNLIMRIFSASILIAVLGIATSARAQGVTVSFTTTPVGGNYAPRNIVAVWVEDAGGTFQKTIGRWAQTRKQYLLTWNQKAGTNDVDAVSGATRASHTGTLTATWDLKNKAGTVVPDGTYTIRMELTDDNATTAAQLHEGTFTFVKSGAPQMQTGLTNGGFQNVAITFSASTACNNGVVDPGEKCDPPGSCPTTCAASADACMPNVIVGTAAACTAECVAQPISACANGDGWLSFGLRHRRPTDDCGAGGAGGGGAAQDLNGGCASGGGAGSLLVLVAFAMLRRRRN